MQAYDGGPISDNPQLRAVTGTLRATISCMLASTSSMRVRFNWQWRTYPVIMEVNDVIGVVWQGVSPQGTDVKLRYKSGSQNSYATVQYYDGSMTYAYSNNVELKCIETYGGARAIIPRAEGDYFAKAGNATITVDVVGSGQVLEGSFRWAYGTADSSSDVSISLFTLSLSIGFGSGTTEVFNDYAVFDCEGNSVKTINSKK